jgi:hypothetical protein
MKRRRMQSLASTLLLIVSLGLFALVAVLYFRDDDTPTPPARTPVAGQNQAIDILEALRQQGLDAEFGPPESYVTSRQLETVGQTIALETGTAFMFIYQNPSAQKEILLDTTIADVDLEEVSGAPIDTTDAHLFTNSNVAVVLINSTEDEAEKVSDAIALLP